jgi:alkanesulfonate monooxygenase SsuD/methylene tetrahydromethanopterin reductase-like flavin-dependent oxidoreductase (luciferase family)
VQLSDLRIFTEPQQGATYHTLLAVALRSEQLGFGAFFRSDHYLAMGEAVAALGPAGLPGPTDAWITLAGLARDPGVLAITVAQVDEMSGGRVELGIGAGWFAEEHHANGLPFGSLAERFDMLSDQLAIIDGFWNTPVGETFSYTGPAYSIVGSPGLPKPVQQRLPIIMGGGGKTKTPHLAAQYASEFNTPFVPMEFFVKQCDRVRAACAEIGRTELPVFSGALVVCAGADEAEVARRAAAIGRDVGELRDNGAAGTAQEVADTILRWNAAGAERIYLQVLDLADLDHLDFIATEVAPLLA